VNAAPPVNGVIAGVAKDSGNNPISGVTVSLSVSGTDYQATTDENGTYSIAGVPAGAGYTVTASKTGYNDETVTNVTVTAGNTTTVDFTLTTIPAPVPPSISTASLPDGTVNTAYSQTLTASGDTPITWSLDSGSLPTGLTLSNDGGISGTPTAAGTLTLP